MDKKEYNRLAQRRYRLKPGIKEKERLYRERPDVKLAMKNRADKHNGTLSWIRKVLRTVKHRAKKKGIEFSLTEEDLTLPEICPVFDVPFESAIGARSAFDIPYSPSVDRIDPTKGYIPGNVKIISLRANRIKMDATIEEVEAVLKYMKENYHNGYSL